MPYHLSHAPCYAAVFFGLRSLELISFKAVGKQLREVSYDYLWDTIESMASWPQLALVININLCYQVVLALN